MKTEQEIRKVMADLRDIISRCPCDASKCEPCQIKAAFLCALEWVLDEAGVVGDSAIEKVAAMARRT